MLDVLSHRGPAGRAVVDHDGATLGLAWTGMEDGAEARLRDHRVAADETSNSRFARAEIRDGRLALVRDPLGVAPLYYGTTSDGHLCFASEFKALLGETREIHEFPPGRRYTSGRFEPCHDAPPPPPLEDPPGVIARELRRRLEQAVARRMAGTQAGAWLSGGLDSSTMTALARPHVRRLPTFAVGLAGAPDLEYARAAAEHLDTEHHEILVGVDDLLAVLPEVIYHLESFDALLVRSSLVNFLASRRAGDHVPAVLSGEAGDELFAGYDYLRNCPPDGLSAELADITGRLHNTALQRVDRSAAAYGTIPFVGFTDPDLVAYAQRIPAKYKLHEGVEKWILRRAMDGELPGTVLHRKKEKFWSGAGVRDLLADHAAAQIPEAAFRHERRLPNGWTLHSREELMYYRIFRERFGVLEDLSFMGRTKGAPVTA
ncbi:MAG: asparagine synthase-related protein [Actinomycetota bacterium]